MQFSLYIYIMKRSKNSNQELTLFPIASESTFSISSVKQNSCDQIQENNSCRIIPIEKFRREKDNELKNKFYSLSDHLD
jgi:hypothetical protein